MECDLKQIVSVYKLHMIFISRKVDLEIRNTVITTSAK